MSARLTYVVAVRVLLACSLGGLGHLRPMAAAARALGRLGHQTLVLVPPSLEQAADDAGLAFRVGGEPPRPMIDLTPTLDEVLARSLGLQPLR